MTCQLSNYKPPLGRFKSVTQQFAQRARKMIDSFHSQTLGFGVGLTLLVYVSRSYCDFPDNYFFPLRQFFFSPVEAVAFG
jgi:hypothetical protein